MATAARRQHITIFTTASLPWMTGTAVNPLFRAAYLAKAGDWEVTLVVPWLSKGDQMLVYPNKMKFSGPAEQEGYVRRWLEERTGALPRFNINFYPGKASSSALRAWGALNDADKKDAFESMRRQLKVMEQTLKAARGVAKVQRSKRLRAEAQLEGLVESMKRMAEEIKCVRGDETKESDLVRTELTTLNEPATQSKNPLWADKEKARVFAVLRERVGQVPRLISFCERVLHQVHDAMFPLNVAPQGLADLFRFFQYPDKVRGMVRAQLRAGARAALALIHVQWPGVDLMEVAGGPPRGRQEDMAPHYQAADGPSVVIVKKILEEFDRIAGEQVLVKQEVEP